MKLAEYQSGLQKLQTIIRGASKRSLLSCNVENSTLRIAYELDDGNWTAEADVTYSMIFECPVLYFRFYDVDGNRLRLQQYFELGFGTATNASDLMVSEGIHPDDCRPWFYVHPCQTPALLKFTQELAGTHAMFLWFSTVCCCTGLELNLENLSRILNPP
eukprot:ANDGO_03195.mRNA.1 hypothetical protein